MDAIIILEVWILSLIYLALAHLADYDNDQEPNFGVGLTIILFAPTIAIYDLVLNISKINLNDSKKL
jgi:hypothetical protein